jgi:uncharacterized membrane protein
MINLVRLFCVITLALYRLHYVVSNGRIVEATRIGNNYEGNVDSPIEADIVLLIVWPG